MPTLYILDIVTTILDRMACTEPHLSPRDVIDNCDACYGSIVNSLCLSVCLPVCPSHSCAVSKWLNLSSNLLSNFLLSIVVFIIPIFSHQMLWDNLYGFITPTTTLRCVRNIRDVRKNIELNFKKHTHNYRGTLMGNHT